jgi:hypothetical protein
MEDKLIAPCGMNCGVCVSYLAMENDLNRQGFTKAYCEGCLPRGKNCLHMGDQCRTLREGLVRFCYECADFPCKQLKNLNKRYSTKYHLSMIDNLNTIKEEGIESFLIKEEEKWACPDCGGTICCHNGLCLKCKVDKLFQNKKYRWGEE